MRSMRSRGGAGLNEGIVFGRQDAGGGHVTGMCRTSWYSVTRSANTERL
jgi:hypothetical protein